MKNKEKFTYCFHFLEGGEEGYLHPGVEGGERYSFDVGHDVLDGIGGEGAEDELS